MSIQKKSLISALKTTKKANVASAPVADGKSVSSMRGHNISAKGVTNAKGVSAKGLTSAKGLSAKGLTSAKGLSAKGLTSAKGLSAKGFHSAKGIVK